MQSIRDDKACGFKNRKTNTLVKHLQKLDEILIAIYITEL
jgi:hypothetical protein